MEPQRHGSVCLGAGVIPYSVEPGSGEVFYVVGHDRRGWGYFGGKCEGEPCHVTASRELYEESIGLLNVPVHDLARGLFTAKITSRMPMTSKYRTEKWADYTVYLVQVPWDPEIRQRFRITRRVLQSAEYTERGLSEVAVPEEVSSAMSRFKNPVHILQIYVADTAQCSTCGSSDKTPRPVKNYAFDGVRLRQAPLVRGPAGAWCEACVENCHIEEGEPIRLVVKVRMGTASGSIVTLSVDDVPFDPEWILATMRAESNRNHAIKINSPAVSSVAVSGGKTTRIHVRKRFMEKTSIRLMNRTQLEEFKSTFDPLQHCVIREADDLIRGWEVDAEPDDLSEEPESCSSPDELEHNDGMDYINDYVTHISREPASPQVPLSPVPFERDHFASDGDNGSDGWAGGSLTPSV